MLKLQLATLGPSPGDARSSGPTGKAGLSLYYPAQFMREQSHTIVD